MSHSVHILWGSIAAGLYRSGILDMGVRLAHSRYEFATEVEAKAFLRGVDVSREQGDWVHVQNEDHIRELGPCVVDLLATAAKNGDVRVVVHLLRLEVACNLLDDQGYSPLHHACENGHNEVVMAFVEHGADLNIATGCARRKSPVQICAAHGSYAHSESLRILLDNGARLTDLDADGNSALHVAAAHGNLDAVRILLAEGAGVLDTNRFEELPYEVVGRPSALEGVIAAASMPDGLEVRASEIRHLLEKAMRAESQAEEAASHLRTRKKYNKFGFER